RLAFAVAVSVEADTLLFDEILAVGDAVFANKCLRTIEDFRNHGKTIVLVTHDASKVLQWCDVAVWLDQGRVAGLGDPPAVVGAYGRLVTELDA
ncbi:MAG: sugar ABC transporter ATP-binding protein, partial [Candidatus Eremiobacteraeota bacterium]|nr:sugar ABC transporter ATP-binding protein [Candidatus Eremiobacteraeota bacterium]